jgi:thiol-disulfide isomerase/thioredoxin
MKRILYIMLLIITVISLTLALYSCDNDGNSGNGGSQGSGDGGSQDSGNSGTQDNGGNGTYTPDPDFVQPPLGNTVGKTAFSKALTLVDGSGTVSVSELRGKVVVINFWGTWCGPCKSELPDFDELATEYKDDVVFLVIHSVNGSANAKSYIDTHFEGSKMVFAFDEVGTEYTDKYYGLLDPDISTAYYPRTLVLDRNGVITYTVDGAIPKETLRAEIISNLE